MLDEQNFTTQDVAAIITAMTDSEQPFLLETLEAVLSDPGIGQVVLCVEENNDWVDSVIGSLIKDSRLDIVRIPLVPAGAVRNKALNHVQKPWVAYCDGDDVWCKGKTLVQRTYARKTGADFIGCDHYLTDEKGRIRAFALARYIPMTSSWMVRTEIMKQYPFNEKIYPYEDGEWWIRTNNIIQKVRYPKMLLRYRVRFGSISSTTRSKKQKAKIVTLASIPVLGSIILFLTWWIWLFTRQKQYVWHPNWVHPNYSTPKTSAIL